MELSKIQENCVIRIVDDDEGLRDALNLMLSYAGWNVKTYGSAKSFFTDDQPSRPPVSSAKTHVMIFVVLAIGRTSSPFLENKIRPFSASIRTAARAYSSLVKLVSFFRSSAVAAADPDAA